MKPKPTRTTKVGAQILFGIAVLLVAGIVVLAAMSVSRTGAETGVRFDCGRPLSMTKNLNDDGQYVCKPALNRRRQIMAGLGIVVVLTVGGTVAIRLRAPVAQGGNRA